MPKTGLENYFQFTRKEKNGVLIVLFFILLFGIVPFIYPLIFKQTFSNPEEYRYALDSLELIKKDSTGDFAKRNFEGENYRPYDRSPSHKYDDGPEGELFYFDPNTLSLDGWKKLGVKEKTAVGIQHYIEKGGKFKTPEDIRKIWGIRPALQEKLLAYVRIPAAAVNGKEEDKKYPVFEKRNFYKTGPAAFDINDGDTTEYIALPGIGSRLAGRIINYRNKLGGFYSVNQVGETFGLPDSSFQKIRSFLTIDAQKIKKIDLNTVTQEELKAHPYIRWQLANVIIQYRTQHGNFSSVNDLKKIMIITEEIFNRISPYLKCTGP